MANTSNNVLFQSNCNGNPIYSNFQVCAYESNLQNDYPGFAIHEDPLVPEEIVILHLVRPYIMRDSEEPITRYY